MKKFLSDRPWIWLLLGFLLTLGALVATIVIAVKHEPAPVPLEQPHGR